MLKNIHEILTEVANSKSEDDAVLVLKYNSRYALKSVLQGMFNPTVKFCITKIPEYKVSDAPVGMGYTSIDQEIHRAYLFVEGDSRSKNLDPKRREQILIQILEALESKEAEVFANMVLKNNPYKGLTYNVVKKAFPDILV